MRLAPQVEVTALLAGTKLSRTSALALTVKVPTTSNESSYSATPPEVNSIPPGPVRWRQSWALR